MEITVVLNMERFDLVHPHRRSGRATCIFDADESSALKMEAACSSEASEALYPTTWRHIVEDSHIQNINMLATCFVAGFLLILFFRP
jgi:hypothetical protein